MRWGASILADRSMTVLDDHRELCERLNSIEPGYLPPPVFRAFARLVVLPTFVVVPLRRIGDKVFVLLTAREASDPDFAGLLQTQGTVIRPTDESLDAAYDRLVRAELPGVSLTGRPVFVYTAFDRLPRGREISLVHWVEVDGAYSGSSLFDVDALPDDIIATELPRIRQAAQHFRRHHGAEGG